MVTVCPAGTKLSPAGTSCAVIEDKYDTQKPRSNDRCEGTGNPIFPMTGAKRELVATGIRIGSVPLDLTYSSARQLNATASTTSAKDFGESPSFGALWQSSLHRSLRTNSAGMNINALRGDGVAISYNKISGLWVGDAENNDTLVATVDGYRYTDAQTQSVETYTSAGQLTWRVDAAGRTLNFSYSTAATPLATAPAPGYLIQVTDNEGRSIKFAYTLPSGGVASTDAKIATITTSSGGGVTPSYDSNANLTGLIWEDGKTRQVLYENTTLPWALTGVVDERGLRYSTFTYDTLGRATASEHAGSTNRHSLTYQTPPQLVVTETYDAARNVYLRTHSWQVPAGAVVTTPNGSTSNLAATVTAGYPRISSNSQPAGSGCAAATSAKTFDAIGNILSQDNFQGERSCYAYDSKNRETTRVEGLATTVSCTTVTPTNAVLPAGARRITSQWHPDWRVPTVLNAPGSITTSIYHGQPDPLNGNAIANCTSASALPDGKLLPLVCKQVVQATLANGALDSTVVNRTSSYTYDSTGRVLTSQDALNQTTTYAYYPDTVMNGLTLDESVSLLLHGDGLNNATTFSDSSATPKSITAVGNAQISTAQSKFGGSSMLFDGNVDFLIVPNSASVSLVAGDFTVEAWVYLTALTGGNLTILNKDGVSGSSYSQYDLSVNASGKLAAFLGNGNGVSPAGTSYTGSTTVSTGAWHHVAMVKSGTTFLGFLDGTLQWSAPAATMFEGSKPLLIGYQAGRPTSSYLNGYIDDLRITKGLARYTAAFTPPVAAFANPALPVASPSDIGHTRGDLQSMTNAAGHVTTYNSYDRAGRLRQMTDPKGVVTAISYTPRGWVASVVVTPPALTARTTTYGYDFAGQLTSVTNPDGSVLSYSYDGAHRMTGATDAKGNSVTYTLDNTGQRIAQQIKDPTGVLQRSISRSFDALNRLQQVTGAAQ